MVSETITNRTSRQTFRFSLGDEMTGLFALFTGDQATVIEPAYLPDLIIKTKMFGSKMTHFHWEFRVEELYFCPPQEGAKLISDVLSVSLI